MRRLFPVAIAVTVAAVLAEHPWAAASSLWGANGEKWDKQRIPDFTHAGYKDGMAPLPSFPIKVNVKSIGAKGDGLQDDTKYVRQALAQCYGNASVWFPAGVYRISDTLQVTRSGCAILGEGRGKTIFSFTKGLEQLYPRYNGSQTPWSWSGGMIDFRGSIAEVGISDLTVLFPDSAWAGHDFHERGYNGLAFEKGVNQGWVKGVTITGSDVGLYVAGSHITFQDWILDFGPKRGAAKLQGHHGTNVGGSYNLFAGFRIEGLYQHDLSVEGTPMYNVFMQGSGPDLCFDHHTTAGYDQRFNLFTQIDIGEGSRMYASGGNRVPRGVSFHETWWNVASRSAVPWVTSMGESRNNVIVGVNASGKPSMPDGLGNWFEAIPPQDLQPANLYWAQMKLLHGVIGGSMGIRDRRSLRQGARPRTAVGGHAALVDALGKAIVGQADQARPVFSMLPASP